MMDQATMAASMDTCQNEPGATLCALSPIRPCQQCDPILIGSQPFLCSSPSQPAHLVAPSTCPSTTFPLHPTNPPTPRPTGVRVVCCAVRSGCVLFTLDTQALSLEAGQSGQEQKEQVRLGTMRWL